MLRLALHFCLETHDGWVCTNYSMGRLHGSGWELWRTETNEQARLIAKGSIHEHTYEQVFVLK